MAMRNDVLRNTGKQEVDSDAWLKFEINNDNAVLVDVPLGKQHLHDLEKIVPQKPQVGPNCLYYSFNYIRPRYGRFFKDQKHPQRINEKAISDSIKQKTKIENDNYSDAIKMLAAIKVKPRGSRVDIQKFMEENGNKSDFLIYKQFLDQDIYHNFLDYINHVVNSKKYAVLFEKTIPQLSLANTNVYLKIMNQYINNYSMCNIFFNKYLIPLSYHLEPLKWQSSDSIKNLMMEIKQHGPCYVDGLFGNTFYKKTSHLLEEEFGKRKIHGWNTGEFVGSKDTIMHAIVVIGAAIYENEGYVYYLDPNRPNSENNPEENILYKISYKRFISSIRSVDTPLGNNIFGFRSNGEYRQYLHDFQKKGGYYDQFLELDKIDEGSVSAPTKHRIT